jgi:ligand-binding sensor domain-containing protein
MIPGHSRCGQRLLWLVVLMATFVGGPRAAGSKTGWVSQVWQADGGLIDSRVTGLAQTPEGSLWVATRGGLMRFTGSSFEEFRLASVPGVVGNGARAMYGDPNGDLWLGAFRDAVVRVGADRAQLFTAASGLPPGPFNGFATGRDGVRWLALGARVGWISGDRFHDVAMPVGLTPSGPAAVVADADGQVWAVVSGHLGTLESGSFVPAHTLEVSRAALSPARGGGLWLCAGSQLYRRLPQGSLVRLTSLPTEIEPQCVLEDRNGGVWIGTTSNGLFRCGSTGVEEIEVSHRQVTTLLEDREGSIWAGTFGGGLNRIRPRAVDLMDIDDGLPSQSIISLCRDADGMLWAASAAGHLVRGEGNVWQTLPPGPLWTGHPATCVAADRRGRLWVGTRGHGLVECDLRAGTSRSWLDGDSEASRTIRTLFVAADDSVWVATTAPTRLIHLVGGEVKALQLPGSVRNIRAIVEDEAGVVWIGTSDGQVLKVVDGALAPEPAMVGSITTSIRSLHCTADGSLWIGYAAEAIGHLKEGRYTLLAGSTSLAPDAISQFASDEQGSLWLAGSRGLYRVSLGDALPQTGGRPGGPRAAFYGWADGLPSPQPTYDNFPNVAQGRDGRLFFATSLGVMAVNPKTLPTRAVPPPVLIEHVTVDDHAVGVHRARFPLRPREPALMDLDSGLELAPDHRRLAIRFAALSYAAPQGLQFRYRLVGFDDGWSESVKASEVQ